MKQANLLVLFLTHGTEANPDFPQMWEVAETYF